MEDIIPTEHGRETIEDKDMYYTFTCIKVTYMGIEALVYLDMEGSAQEVIVSPVQYRDAHMEDRSLPPQKQIKKDLMNYYRACEACGRYGIMTVTGTRGRIICQHVRDVL